MRATKLIYLAAGEPMLADSTVGGKCRTCGEYAVGRVFLNWIKDSFNDSNMLFSGEIVCSACLFSFEESSQIIANKMHKLNPQKFRSYSHIVLNGVWFCLGKSQKREIASLLIQNPEVAILAVSGQKHLAFKCPSSRWQIEEHSLIPFPNLLFDLLKVIQELYQAGASKNEIEFFNYNQHTLSMLGHDYGMNLIHALLPYKDSLELKTAVWLAQKEDEFQEESENDS